MGMGRGGPGTGVTRAIVEPQRRTPVIGEPEVLVVGGGAAGIAAQAAAMAARQDTRGKDVPVDELQRTLEREGALLTPKL